MTHYLNRDCGAAVACLVFFVSNAVMAQAPELKPKASENSPDASAKKESSERASFPFQIQLLDTTIRFESNGDSRKEVHTVVKLNDAMGVREFGRLTFDYNRSFQRVEIPMVRITHANGGTSDLLPSAITDVPNPSVEKFPAYQDVRVKAVRVLGLQENDTVEYRVITTTTRPPLAPNFWLVHSFDRSGQVQRENYEIQLPLASHSIISTSVDAQKYEITHPETGTAVNLSYRWNYSAGTPIALNTVEGEPARGVKGKEEWLKDADIAITTFRTWNELKESFRGPFGINSEQRSESISKAQSLTENAKNDRAKLELLYEFVAQKIDMVDLPLSATGYASRSPKEILASGYATPEDKAILLMALARAAGIAANSALTGPNLHPLHEPIVPTIFANVLVVCPEAGKATWLDPSSSVVPFEMMPANLRGKPALIPYGRSDDASFIKVPGYLPFAAFQKVGVNATLGEDGKLVAKVKYVLRGDNELLLRLAFHQTTKDKWKDVAGLLALSDGFRGVVTSVSASEPTATKAPFTVEYELTQEKFVDWAKKPVRIPALLPQIGLPDTSTKSPSGNIELGTPLDVDTQMTLQLPSGTTAQTPAGTAVERDYATYSSKYALNEETLRASRHIKFLRRDLAADRAADYNAFERAVQNDQSQNFVLDRGVGAKNAAGKQ